VHDVLHEGQSVADAMKQGCYTWSPDPTEQQGGSPSSAITPERFFGTWVDVAQYTCQSFDRSEGVWFELSQGHLAEGYGNACNVKLTVQGATLLAEGNECFGEEAPLLSIRREFVLLSDNRVESKGLTFMRCDAQN
jgi:hypothetical protein